MTQKEYMSQFNNISDYMEAVQRDYQEEIGEPMTFEMRWFAYKIGLEYYEPERYERIFCN